MSAIIKDYIKTFILSRNDGTVLTSVNFDSGINESLLSSFISALWILGSKSVGKFSELSLKGSSDYHLVIVSKYDLILSVLLESTHHNYDHLKDDLFQFLTHLYRQSHITAGKHLEKELRRELYKFCKQNKTNKLFWSYLSEHMKIAETG